MAYESTGLAAMFPVYLARMADREANRDDYDIAVAQNEMNLNQNLSVICQKLIEIESYLEDSN